MIGGVEADEQVLEGSSAEHGKGNPGEIMGQRIGLQID